MRVVVQKFGGTCVDCRKAQELSAQRIIDARERGLHPVVVVSAMGREGQPYSTAELVKLVKEIDPKIEPRELDLLMSCGEIISTVAMAHLLKSKGYRTVALSGGQAGLMTDHYHGNAQIEKIKPELVLDALDDDRIVFVAGFQGITEKNHAITTLGEGGSDYTAVALAMKLDEVPQLASGEDLQVMPVEIYKEVDGVMTANPKSLREEKKGRTVLLARPKTLPSITYQELPVLARLGAEVVQYQAAQMASRSQIPLVVRNYTRGEGPTTLVSSSGERSYGREVTAIADLANLILLRLKGAARLESRVSGMLDEHRINHQALAPQGGKISFAIKREKYRDIQVMVQDLLEAKALPGTISRWSWGLVSVIGEGIRDDRERIRGQMEKILRQEGVAPGRITEGEISLSCLVREKDRRRVVAELHKQFITRSRRRSG